MAETGSQNSAAFDEAKARFEAAVDARDRLEAELALSDMKAAVAAMGWELAAASAEWAWSLYP